MSSPPTTLGQYQIIREIARSNDIVYEAYDPLMNRRVAIKELSVPQGTSAPQQEDRINRFKREAQAAGTLNHAHIMTVYSFAEDAGRIFMAMEYLDGCSLRNELDTKGSLPVERAVEIASEVLEGLGHAHNKGVIHRDIKPDNIQILSNGQAKITDFGIARLTFQPNLTMDGQVFGTPSYMSPEQVVGKEIDARSDLFSVGVVLYEMIAGVKPFAGDSVVSITYAIMNKVPDQPPIIPHGIWQVISRVLDKTPHLRFGSAQDMIDALRDAVRKPASLTPTQLTTALPPQTNPNQQNPYAPNPYAQPMASPPPVYTFNPYQPQAFPNQMPYQAGGPTMPPPGPIPIYYPPPPRAPLLKPETVVFLRRLGLTFLILGSIFALAIVIIQAIVSTSKRIDADRNDANIEQVIVENDKRIPIDERISDAERKLVQLKSADRIARASRDIAVLYEERGQNFLGRRDFEHAEADFAHAVQLDPKNDALASDLGKLYWDKASTQSDLSLQAELYRQSAENWQRAGDATADLSRKSANMEASAKAFYYYASIAIQLGDKTAARRALEQASLNAPPNSSIAGEIQREKDRLLQ